MSGLGNTWSANFLLVLIFPLFFRCQVWGILGLPTFRWTSFPLFLRYQVWGVTGLSTFRWTLFLKCQVWGIPCLPSWTSFPLFLRWQIWGYLVCQLFSWTSLAFSANSSTEGLFKKPPNTITTTTRSLNTDVLMLRTGRTLVHCIYYYGNSPPPPPLNGNFTLKMADRGLFP